MVERLKLILKSPGAQLIGWITIGGCLLFLALRQVEPDEIWRLLRQAQPGYIFLALFSVGINTLAKAARWQGMLATFGPRPELGQSLAALVIGQVMNWFIPGRVGDVGRAYVIGNVGFSRSFALGTILLEKVLDMFCYLLVFLFILMMVPLPEIVSQSGYFLTAVTLLLTGAVFIVSRNLEAFIRITRSVQMWVPERLRLLTSPRIETALQSLWILRDAGGLTRLGLWSCLIWGTSVWTNHLVLLSLRVHLSLLASLAILVVVLAGVSIPSVPGRFGVFQYLCILTLSLFNVNPTIGLSYGILLQAIVFLPAILYSLVLTGIFGVKPLFDEGAEG